MTAAVCDDEKILCEQIEQLIKKQPRTAGCSGSLPEKRFCGRKPR